MNIAALFVRLQADISDLERGMKQAQRSLSTTGAAMQDLGRSLRVGLTVPLGLLGALSVRSATQLDSLKRGLTAVAGSSAEAETQLTRLADIAKLPGLGFREAIQGSIRLQAAGFSASLAEDALRGFGNALATVGAGKAELDQVTRALSQIASKGKISAEEINQLAEVVPQIRVVMKEAFGTANSELLQKSGIDAETFVRKVTDALLELEQATGGPANSFENLSDSVLRASSAIGAKLLPVVIPLVDGLARAADTIRQLDAGTVRLGIALAATAALIGPLIGLVSGLAKAYSLLKLAGAAAGLTIGIGSAVAVGLAALSTLFIKNKLDALAAAGAVDDVTESYKGLSKAAAQFELGQALTRQADLRARLSKTPEFVLKQQETPGGTVDVQRVNPDRVALDAEFEGVNEAIRVLSRRISELSFTAEKADDKLDLSGAAAGDLSEAFRLAADAAKAVPEAMEELATATRRRVHDELWAIDRYAAMRGTMLGPNPKLDLKLRPGVPDPVIETESIGSTIKGMVGQFVGLSGSLGPLAVAAVALKPVFDGLRESLGPTIDALSEPLREVGRIVGDILAPVLQVLVEPLRILSQIVGLLAEPLRVLTTIAYQTSIALRLLEPVLTLLGKAISYINSGFGHLLRGIGDLLNKLPGSLGNPLKKLGQSMIDNAEAFRKGERVFGQ